MPTYRFHWSDELVDYLGQHGVSPDEFEDGVQSPDKIVRSKSTGELAAIGWSYTSRRLFCVYRLVNEFEIEPITAYEVEEN
jgi:hypothetical protein